MMVTVVLWRWKGGGSGDNGGSNGDGEGGDDSGESNGGNGSGSSGGVVRAATGNS